MKCSGESIPFVNKFALIGVVLDEYLAFDICSKVNRKISLLKKSPSFNHFNFRITLFKLFIISKYDYRYCSLSLLLLGLKYRNLRIENCEIFKIRDLNNISFFVFKTEIFFKTVFNKRIDSLQK